MILKRYLKTIQIIPQLFLPNAPVYTAWDLGINDACAISIFQLKRVDGYLKPIIGVH